MILLNGLAPIMGGTFLHVVFINVIAIGIEYDIIKRKFHTSNLFPRVVLANLISVIVGTIVVYTVPELIGGAVARPDDYVYTNFDLFSMIVGLICLLISNILIETPAYLIGAGLNKEKVLRLISLVFVANLVTNIPVIIMYIYFVS